MRRLDTPGKRAGFVAMCAGAALLVPSLVWIAESEGLGGRWFWDAVWRVVRFEAFALDDYWPAALGLVLLVAGFFSSVAFDATLGRVVRWVRHGNPSRDH